jgi:hypothetical protein
MIALYLACNFSISEPASLRCVIVRSL